ncbi:DUF4255 domain-containing protein, partial [Agromyces soli]
AAAPAPPSSLYPSPPRRAPPPRPPGAPPPPPPRARAGPPTPAPRYFKLSYLVTAWTQRPDDEHRLLDALMRCFLRYDAVPEAFVVDTLAETGLPAWLSVALPPPEDRAFADVWSSLGGELKPSLDVVVTAPITTGVVYRIGPPVEEGVRAEFGSIGTGTGVGADEDRSGRVPTPEP